MADATASGPAGPPATGDADLAARTASAGAACGFAQDPDADRLAIVELDGSQHADSAHDARRDDWLRSLGFTVLRFWNDEVFRECDEVLETIHNAVVAKPDSSPSDSSPSGGGGIGEADGGGGQTVPRPGDDPCRNRICFVPSPRA